MMKEKTVVCIGIFLILAFLTTCAFYYAGSESSAVNNNMEISGKIISFEINGASAGTEAYGFPASETISESAQLL